MAEEFQLGRGNWWESSSSSSTSSSRNNKFDSGILSSSTTTTAPSASTALTNMSSNFDNWPTQIHVDIKNTADHSNKLHASESSGGVDRGALSADPNLHMMGLGLPSPGIDWNQPFFRGEKAAGSGFRSILQEGLSSDANYQQEAAAASCQQDHHWTQKIYGGNNSDDTSVNDYKMNSRGISNLDHHQQQSIYSSNLDQTAPNYGSPSNMLQGLLISDNQQESNFSSARSLYYPPPYNPSNCDVNAQAADVMPTSSSSSSWSKFPQFLRTSSPPKQQWPLPSHGQSHFSNASTPFWNSTSANMDDGRSGFIPSLLPQIPNPTVDEKPKHTTEVRNINTTVKKTSSDTSNKRPRNNEASSPMPAFKVRKEKMGDRITALQQLVSPFGKTDTASVLSEAIEYIKFLHEQVNVLSTPYMKSGGAPMQHQQQSSGHDKSKNAEGGKQQDLRSRGLCLVPVSSTFPVTHETTVDFWTPTFGGTFR